MTEPADGCSLTLGILHPGELGAALGRTFIDEGFRVIAAPGLRGPRHPAALYGGGTGRRRLRGRGGAARPT